MNNDPKPLRIKDPALAGPVAVRGVPVTAFPDGTKPKEDGR